MPPRAGSAFPALRRVAVGGWRLPAVEAGGQR